MSAVIVAAIAPVVLEALQIAIAGVKIAQNPNATVADLQAFKNQAYASRDNLDAALAEAMAERDAEES